MTAVTSMTMTTTVTSTGITLIECDVRLIIKVVSTQLYNINDDDDK